MPKLPTTGKRHESGYAILMVFMLAAAIAISFYAVAPRVAFESQRDKEQILVDRGEQYKRAIYMYYVGNNRQWPSKIDDLENTNNHRYLRHRYVDPYTGKDEWRLVHTNGTFLTDSLVTPPPATATPGAPGATGSTTASAPLGGTGTLASSISTTAATADPNAPPQVNAQVGRRASDRTLVQNSDFQGQPSSVNPGNDPGYQPFNPASLPPISLYPNGYNAPPVNAPGTQTTPNPTGQYVPPGQQPQPGQPGFNQPVVNQPGVPGFTIPGTNSQVTTPGVSPTNFNSTNFNQPGGNLTTSTGTNPAFPTQFNPAGPGVPGASGTAGGTAPNQAIGLINSLLTTPQQPPTGVGQQPAPAGGGLAGVASTYKGAAIKSYGDRTKYQEWEFVFQLNTQGTLQAPQGAKNGQPAGGPLNGPATGTPGAPGTTGTTAPGGSTSGTVGGTTTGTTMGGFGNN